MTSSQSNQTFRAVAAITFPIAVWLFIIIRYAENIPWFDDFDPFPDFLRKWILAEGGFEKLKLIFQPNNEHRMIWGKLVALVYYKLTGTLDFRFLQVFAAFFTLGTLFLFWKVFRQTGLPVLFFAPIPFFLFHLQYYSTYLWAICGLQHQPVVFFTALTSYLLAKGRFWPALIAAVGANFAMGNGILVWAAGFAILVYLNRPRWMFIWVILGAVNVYLYFYGMSPQGNETSFAFLRQHPQLSFIGFFTFLGGLFDLSPDRNIDTRNIATFIGGFLAGTYAIGWVIRFALLKSRTLRPSPGKMHAEGFLVGILVFILANAFVIALLRPRFGMGVMLVSNYKIYPGLFFAAVYFSVLLLKRPSTAVSVTGLVVAAALWTGSLFNYFPTVRERSAYFRINAYNQRNHQFGLGFEPGSEAAAYIGRLMGFMAEKDIYHLPMKLDAEIGLVKTKPAATLRYLFTVVDNRDTIQIHIPDLPPPPLQGELRFFYVTSGDKIFLFKVEQNLNQGRNFLKKFTNGAIFILRKQILPPGNYKAGIYDERLRSHFSLGEFSVPGEPAGAVLH